uniref:E3 ubiquitin-protein ligase APD1-4 middle domain-containing protein n=1 Tax=Megaselia scalaris TaxID=36166 RepID=T1GJ29_MEGSC
MHGVKRVIVFCLLIVILPSILITIPLYLRKILFADVVYEVAESDIIEIKDGISSIFCEKHSLRMDINFNAFQIRNKPTISTHQKHIRLKKSMTLPDDTLEYWGFYLLRGAHVKLKFCSRYEGSRILVVKGGRTLNTCGLLDHNKNKYGANFLDSKINVFYEDIKELDPSPSPPAAEDTEEKTSNKTKKEYFKNLKNQRKIDLDEEENHAEEDTSDDDENPKTRLKRDHVYERKYSHGGNAQNFTEDESTSISSFENGLFECYDGNILLAEGFPPQQNCSDPHYLENGSQRMVTVHEVTEDGYYYYIFYSDNDLVKNDIHAIFDIYKPTFQYHSNSSGTQGCVNSTNCSFPIGFMSDEIVIVEIPTRDGIEHEEDDIAKLYSKCHPRTYVYAIFPISVLILILSCAFL